MSTRRALYYLLFVDAFVNAVNYAIVRLHVAGGLFTTLVAAPPLYAVLLAVGAKLRGGKLIQEYRRNAGDSLTLTWGYFGASFLASLFVGLTILSFIIGVGGLNTLLHYEYPTTPIQPQSLQATLVLAAFSLLVVGPAEETIFRGAAFGLLLDSSGWENWRRLNLAQALAFGLAHLYYFYLLGPLGAVAFVEIAGMGYGLGWAYYKSGGGLAGPILVHGLWDASSFLLLYPTTAVLGGLLKLLFFALPIYSAVKIADRNRRYRIPQTPSYTPPY